MKQCLIDSSSAILLFKSGLFRKLAKAYRIVMTVSVYEELTVTGYPGAQEFAEYGATNVVIIQSPDTNHLPEGLSNDGLSALDQGERDTIRCYERAEPDSFIITDDGKAAQYCRRHKIPYINALLFARIAYLSGMLPESDYRDTYAELTSIGRYSEEIMVYAQQCSRVEIASFLP
jgi:hypothetical protein